MNFYGLLFLVFVLFFERTFSQNRFKGSHAHTYTLRHTNRSRLSTFVTFMIKIIINVRNEVTCKCRAICTSQLPQPLQLEIFHFLSFRRHHAIVGIYQKSINYRYLSHSVWYYSLFIYSLSCPTGVVTKLRLAKETRRVTAKLGTRQHNFMYIMRLIREKIMIVHFMMWYTYTQQAKLRM